MAGAIEDVVTNAGNRELVAAILLTVILGLVGWWSRRGARNAEQANRAVNGNPEGEPRLYQRVVSIGEEQGHARDERAGIREDVANIAGKVDQLFEGQQEFQRRWGNLPPEMDDAVDLMSMFDRITRRLERMEEGRKSHGQRLDRVEEGLHKIEQALTGGFPRRRR